MKIKNNHKNSHFFGVGLILPYIKPYRKVLILVVICGILSTDFIMPVFQRYALDHFVAQKTFDTLPTFIAIYISILIFMNICNYIAGFKSSETEMVITRDLRNKAFNHVQTLSFSYFNQNSVGYIFSRIINDTQKIGTLFSWNLMDIVWNGTYFVGSAVVMLIIDLKLALLVLAVVPVIVILYSLFQSKMLKINREIKETEATITGDFNEGITGAKTVKTLVIEKKMFKHFSKNTRLAKNKNISSSHLRGYFSATMNMASSVAIALLLWKGSYIAANEIGTFSMFMTYAMALMEPLRWVIESLSDLITTQVNIERFVKLINTESDVTDSPEVIEKYGDTFNPKRENWENIHGDIEFIGVDFKYPDGNEYVLRNFNLKIPFGSNIAVVGETGAGKSTLVNLLCRFFEPTKGKILLDGKDLRCRSQLWLHSSIGYVLQTPHLFSGTIRQNLLYGNLNATNEEISAALKLVSADNVVNNLEKGLDTDVGEGGNLLSTGEKQLISFARAILANPKLLILDEATASVDTITEQKIQSAIGKIIKGRTSVVIAHRLSTIQNADLILVVKDGKIIEKGTHNSLLNEKGYYYSLYNHQYCNEETNKILV